MSRKHAAMTTWGILIAFAHAVSWGATSVLLRHLSLRLDVFVLNGLRALLGAVVVVAWFLAAGAPGGATLTSGKMLVIVASIVVGGLLGDTCNVVALRLIGVSRAVPLTSSFPVFTVLFAFLLWGDAPSPLAIVGALLVVGGAALLSSSERDAEPARPQEGGSAVRVEVARRHRSLGLLLAAATAAAWGLETVLTAIAAEGTTTLAVNAVRVPAAALLSLTVALRRPGAFDAAQRALRNRSTMWGLILASLLGWVVGSTLYVESIKLVGVTLTATIGATAPLYAAPLSALLLREPPSPLTVVGTLLAVAGVILVIAI